jgi:ferredoxin-thioredoxin reductase catalytic chain
MNRQELRKTWEDFAQGNDFMLNPDSEFVERIIDGVLANEKSSGLKLCPCRLSDGSRDGKISLLCPCNFRTHATWEKEDRFWCGLFVKREKVKG